MACGTQLSIEARSGQNVLFLFGNNEVTITTDNVLATFSKPTVRSHVTTASAMLAQLGVPLEKLDYLGNMQAGH